MKISKHLTSLSIAATLISASLIYPPRCLSQSALQPPQDVINKPALNGEVNLLPDKQLNIDPSLRERPDQLEVMQKLIQKGECSKELMTELYRMLHSVDIHGGSHINITETDIYGTQNSYWSPKYPPKNYDAIKEVLQKVVPILRKNKQFFVKEGADSYIPNLWGRYGLYAQEAEMYKWILSDSAFCSHTNMQFLCSFMKEGLESSKKSGNADINKQVCQLVSELIEKQRPNLTIKPVGVYDYDALHMLAYCKEQLGQSEQAKQIWKAYEQAMWENFQPKRTDDRILKEIHTALIHQGKEKEAQTVEKALTIRRMCGMAERWPGNTQTIDKLYLSDPSIDKYLSDYLVQYLSPVKLNQSVTP